MAKLTTGRNRAEDDPLDFDRPWSPWRLVTLSLLVGLLPAGRLLALNFPRLGMRGRLVPGLLLVAVLGLVIDFAPIWLLASGVLRVEAPSQNAWLRPVVRSAAVLVTMVLASMQQQRYRLFQASGLPAGRLLWPAIAAIAIGLFVGLINIAVGFYLVFFGR